MILVVAESLEGKVRKSALESVYYGSRVASMLQTSCNALIIGDCQDGGRLAGYGAAEVWNIQHENLKQFDSQQYAQVIAQVAKDKGAKVVILSDSSTGKSILGRLAVRLNAGSVRGVNSLPQQEDGKLIFRCPVFSGKASAICKVHTELSVITLMGNSIKPVCDQKEIDVQKLSVEVNAPKTKVVNVNRATGTIPLPEAEIVVSAGRGMKDPANWPMIETLAKELGATTACSRPVADSGWRPHHEHVGQTGIAIRPNLYIAIGISGAIQHLAGVNSSKVIVVINKDPEAPFFKAADYGVVGDLFEVVPRLTEALQRFNDAHH